MYNKIFTKILDSSIWLEPDATRIVWLTCIAAMDEDGFCAFASPANLAHRANVTLTAALAALETLEGPDANSSDHDNEGRRLERVPGGWMVLNAAKYRELVSRELAKLGNRRRVQRHRDAKRSGNGVLTQANESVTLSEAETEAETRSDTHTQERVRATAAQALPPETEIASRAAALLETYTDLYAKHRKGAKHLTLGGSSLDWTEACKLCQTWDDARLTKLMDIFLTTDDEWISSTARTFRVFVTRASWCDDRLAQWEAKRKHA